MGWSLVNRQNGTDIVTHTFEWLSDGSGNAVLASGIPVSGEIKRVVFVPSLTLPPTALYDVTLTDENGIDVLGAQGANLPASGNTNVCPGVPMKDGTTTTTRPFVVDDVLTLNVSNAGSAKSGKVIVYVR